MTECLKTEVIVNSQCQFLVERKKRLCRMSVRPGRSYCSEHDSQPPNDPKQDDTRVPCPYDPKHSCYASKLEKHLTICNARPTELPVYIVHNINSPGDGGGEGGTRRLLNEVPPEELLRVINKVNHLYEKHVEGEIAALPERPIHSAVAAEFDEAGRAEGSRRHLRQASALLHLVEQHGLVQPGTCYVELGAGKGRLSYYAGVAWCGGGASADSRVVLVDRAALRHKRDNKLRGPAGGEAGGATRLRADLAHLALERVPAVAASRHVVGFAKHLCGVATDLALRCVAGPGGPGALGKTRGLVLATCCHHRCERAPFVGQQHLQELGVSDEELQVMLGVVSWATCGVGEARAQSGRRAKALLDWARACWLRGRGFAARLAIFVPEHVSPENVCIVATR